MSLRPPSQFANDALAGRSRTDAGINLLEHEIAGEMAAALGRAGSKVEASLSALRATGADAPERPALVKAAAQSVHAYFIQRELCGFRRHQDVIREYAIPGEVLARLGAA